LLVQQVLGQLRHRVGGGAGLQARVEVAGAERPAGFLRHELLGRGGVEPGQRVVVAERAVRVGRGDDRHDRQRHVDAARRGLAVQRHGRRELAAHGLRRAEELQRAGLGQRDAFGAGHRRGEVARQRPQRKQLADVVVGQQGPEPGVTLPAVTVIGAGGQWRIQGARHQADGRLGVAQARAQCAGGDVGKPFGGDATGAAHAPLEGDHAVGLGQAGVGPELVAHHGGGQQRQRQAQGQAEDDEGRGAGFAAQLPPGAAPGGGGEEQVHGRDVLQEPGQR
jgi:hypothetical protein